MGVPWADPASIRGPKQVRKGKSMIRIIAALSAVGLVIATIVSVSGMSPRTSAITPAVATTGSAISERPAQTTSFEIPMYVGP